MIYFSIVLIVICFIQFFHIRTLHKQLSEWLNDLKGIHKSPNEKLFIQKNGILSEITFELNDILNDYQKQIAQLKKADIANKQILTNLSHDVRTPLASLIGYLEALNHNMADNPKEYVEISYQKSLALKSLIDLLFEWCKISSNEQQYHLLPADVNELTREVIIDWLPIMEKKNITLKVHISEDELTINIDCIAYKRIINNLIQNAIHHGNCSIITIHIETKNTKICISVSNNGTLISKEKLPYIFERLYKCDDARLETGSGLGLAIAKELVNAMNGIIDVDSSSTQGTTFTIFFPWM